MLEIVLSNRFKKDLKLAAKRGYNIELLDSVVTKLANREPLPENNRDHELTGNYIGFCECHIQPDWLLVYRVEESQLILFLSRTGTHSNCFKPKATSVIRSRFCYVSAEHIMSMRKALRDC